LAVKPINIRVVLKKEKAGMNVVRNLVLGIGFAGALAGAAVFAQQEPARVGVVPVTTSAPAEAVISAGNGGFSGYYVQRTPYGAGDAQLAKDYVKAEKEDAKKEIRKKLTESLAKQFDQHLQQQQKELDDLEKQIATLKDVVKKRQAAKNEIVERRLEQLIRDAEGLGWNAPGSPRPYPNVVRP
jgi:uncharacterized protein HemX